MKTTHWPISLLSGTASMVSLLIPIVMSRVLPASDIGSFRVFFLYLQLTPALSLTAGILNGLYYWAGRGESGSAAVRGAFRLLLACSFGFPLLGLGVLAIFPSLGGGSALAWLFVFAIPPTLLGTFYEHAAVARGRVWSGGAFTAGFECLRASAIVAAILVTRDVRTVILIAIGMSWLKAAIGLALAWQQGLIPRGAPRNHEMRDALSYALPVSFSTVLDLIALYGDRLILSAFLPAARYAVYSMGCLAIPPLLILEQSVNKVLIPRLSECLARDDRPGAVRVYRDAIEEMMFFHLPAAVGLAIFARPIVEILFTATYLDAAVFLRVYAIWYVFMAVPDDSAARAAGDSRWILKVTAVFSGLTVLAVLLGVNAGGAMGVLIAYLAMNFAQKAYAMGWVARRLDTSLAALFPWRSVSAFAGLVLLCATASLAARSGFVSEKNWFLVCAPLFAVAYLLAGIYVRSLPRLRRLKADSDSSAPPRVLMIMPYLSIGGLEVMVLGLSRELKARGLADPSVLTFEAKTGALRAAFEAEGIAVQGLEKGPGFSFRLPFRIASLARRNEIQVLHTHDLGALIYGVFAKWISGGSLRLVHTQHSFLQLVPKRRQLWYDHFFSRRADVLCTVSEELVRTYKTRVGLGADRVNVVANGVSFPSEAAPEDRTAAREAVLETVVSPSLLARRDTLWLLSLARVTPGKGQDVLIRLWQTLSPDERAGATLVIVGPGVGPDWVSALTEKAGEDVIFAGPTLQSSLWYDAADAYLSGSLYEGMPLGPLEAIGRGMPALLSDIPGHRLFEGFARFFLRDDEAQGAKALGTFLKELRNGALGTRKVRWESARVLRESNGVTAMGRAYAGFYRKK
jgi:O-antigen/teichoic acid export membrane protein/glycosyltransferase involved in cell wall biosynthesis